MRHYRSGRTMTGTLIRALFVLAIGQPVISGQAIVPPPLSPEQEQQLRQLPADTQVYERFRYWAGLQPPEIRREAERHYDAYLSTLGVPQQERGRQLKIIDTEGRRLEIERWNRILTAAKPAFNTNPNAFLVEMVKGRTPGTALEVGMGQGRNLRSMRRTNVASCIVISNQRTSKSLKRGW